MFATQPPPAATFQGFSTFGAPGSSHECQYNYKHAPMNPSPLAMSSTSSSKPSFSFATQQQQQVQPASLFFQPQPQSQPQHQSQDQQSNSKPGSYYATRYANTVANPFASRRNGGSTTAANRSARNPSGATSPEARAHRRTLFLNRIKQDRDAGRFEARGEQLVLMEDVAEERRRRESMARRAERIMRGFGIDEEEQGREWDEDTAAQLDEFLSQEQELEAAEMERLEMLEIEQQQQGQNRSVAAGSYSDDDEYDDIFMDLAGPIAQSQGMDLSSG